MLNQRRSRSACWIVLRGIWLHAQFNNLPPPLPLPRTFVGDQNPTMTRPRLKAEVSTSTSSSPPLQHHHQQHRRCHPLPSEINGSSNNIINEARASIARRLAPRRWKSNFCCSNSARLWGRDRFLRSASRDCRLSWRRNGRRPLQDPRQSRHQCQQLQHPPPQLLQQHRRIRRRK